MVSVKVEALGLTARMGSRSRGIVRHYQITVSAFAAFDFQVRILDHLNAFECFQRTLETIRRWKDAPTRARQRVRAVQCSSDTPIGTRSTHATSAKNCSQGAWRFVDWPPVS
jgi:hypothetical protein